MSFPDEPGTLHKGQDMAQFSYSTLAIFRRKQVQAESGYPRSTLYLRIAQGLWPKPVSLGARAVGWPAGEVSAVAARTEEWPKPVSLGARAVGWPAGEVSAVAESPAGPTMRYAPWWHAWNWNARRSMAAGSRTFADSTRFRSCLI